MGKSTKIAILVIVTALVTAVVAIGVSTWLRRPTPDYVTVTVESIHKVAQVATVKYHSAAWMERTFHSDIIPGLWDVESDLVLAYYTGTVTGSVDLENAKIGIEKKSDGNYVSIHFPPGSVKISGVEIDPERDVLKMISCGGKFYTKKMTPVQREHLEKDTLNAIKNAALDGGIVEKTKSNAEDVLTEFLGSLGYQAKITFDKNAYDPSHAPSASSG